MSNRDDIQVKTKPEPFNSFVSLGAKFEFEIDLMDIEAKGATSNTRYGLVAICNFSTIADVVPIKHKPTEETIFGWLNKK